MSASPPQLDAPPLDAPRFVAAAAARGALLGAAAGAAGGLFDLASTVLWLATAADQARLAVSLLALGTAAGALTGALAGACLASARPLALRALALRLAALLALPAAAVAHLLFTGGRARRLPALWALRPLAWLALTAGGALALALAGRAIARLRARGAPAARVVTAAALTVAGWLLHGADHRVLPRLYEYLHAGLGVLTALAVAAAVALVARAPARPRRALVVTAVGAPLALALALAALERWDNARAEVFGVHAPFVRHLALALEALRAPARGRSPTDDLAARRTRYARERALGAEPRDTAALPRAPGAHVILLTVDALRADRLERRTPAGAPLAPTLADLAARGVRFTRAYAQAPHSSYSLASMHTSEYLHETVPLGQAQPLATAADVFTSRGYHAAALYTNGVFFTEGERLTVYRDRHFGFRRADHVDRDAPAQAEAAMRELDDLVRRGEPPGFLWVHFFDAHEPYQGAGPTPEARYDAAVARVDAAIARLLAHARARLGRELVVALAADHGEEFGEHGGVYHGSSVYDEQVRVPLVIAAPGLAPARVDEPVELIDLAPTLLALCDVPRAPSMRGRDLRPLAVRAAAGAPAPEPARAPRAVFAAVNTRTMALRWPYKLVADLRYGTSELYDLSRDPAERRNLAQAAPAELASLRGELAAWIDALGAGAASSAALARGRLGDRGAIAPLLALALDAREPLAARLDAIATLAEFRDRAAVAPLAALLTQPVAPALADRAAAALGAAGITSALPRLREAVTREAPEARALAALALARLGDTTSAPLALPALVERLATGDEAARLAAVDALGQLGDRAALEPLLEAMEDDHLRYRAVLALGALREPRVRPLLERTARADRGDDVRANAAAALALAGPRDATVPLLVRLLRDDPSAQRYAVAALAHLGAIGREFDGWDARAPAPPTAFAACAPIDDDPVLRQLGARACRADPTAALSFTLRDAARPLLMVVRARGTGALTLRSDARGEIARLPLSDAWQEWRVPLAPSALDTGANHLTARAEGPFELAHLALLPAR